MADQDAHTRQSMALMAFFHGRLARHADGPAGFSYGLFNAVSVAMGLGGDSSDAMLLGEPAWVNLDCGPQSLTQRPEGWIAGFAAHVECRPESSRLVVPFLVCTRRAVDQVGVLDLAAVQVLVPVGPAQDPGLETFLCATAVPLGWASPSPTRVRVSLSTGAKDPDGSCARAALTSAVLADQDVLHHTGPITLGPPADWAQEPSDAYWPGPNLVEASIEGLLAEWSEPAIGWVCQRIAQHAVDSEVRTPVLVTVTRADASRQELHGPERAWGLG